MLTLLPLLLGLAGVVAAAVVFFRAVADIRSRDRAVVARHLQAMQERAHQDSPTSTRHAERR